MNSLHGGLYILRSYFESTTISITASWTDFRSETVVIGPALRRIQLSRPRRGSSS